MLEKKAPKHIRSTEVPTVITSVIHDRGLEFNNGLIIRHISTKVYNYFDSPIVKIKERNPNY